jgi:hypothetical protein
MGPEFRKQHAQLSGIFVQRLAFSCNGAFFAQSPSKESAANLTSSIRAQQGAARPRNFTTLSSLAGDGCCGRAGDRRHGHRNNVQLGRFGRNRSNGWHYPGANSFARYSEEGNLLKPITWQFYHLSNT